MRVVDVRDFCIPSDENDYDELVAFAETMAGIPQFDAVPMDVFDKIRSEIEHMIPCGKEALSMKLVVLEIIDKYLKVDE